MESWMLEERPVDDDPFYDDSLDDEEEGWGRNPSARTTASAR
ncbi:hypothetical protein [Halomonas sp. E19]